MTHYIIIAKVEDFSAEYYKLRELVEKFIIHFNIYGSFYHVTTIGEPIPLEVLTASVREAIGTEASCYVGRLAEYDSFPKREVPQEYLP
jgi:hypothetical protein